MSLLIVLFVALVIVAVGVGVLWHRSGRTIGGGPTHWGARLALRLGRAPAAVLIAVSGWVLTALVSLGLGFAAKNMETGVDRPVFDWVHSRVGHGWFTTLNTKLTLMGYNPNVEIIALVAIIVLACVFGRRWWLPIVAILLAFAAEKYMQKWLAAVVDRGHPPTTAGTYPSGGVGRMLGIYSMIVVLVIVAIPAMSRAWRAGLWIGMVTASLIEGFTRVYLSLHWFTDVLFAFVFGAMLLITNIAAIGAATSTRARASGDPAVTGAPERLSIG